MKFLRSNLGFITVFLLSIFSILPLFHPGFFPMHDDEQIARLYELHQTLSAGQFPPRWVGNLGFGYGYPFYNFYPPLVYYLGEIFHISGFSFIASTKIVMALGFLLSGMFMYLLAKEFFGKIGGIVAAIFYVYAPYHSVDLYVRGALAEFYSFVFLPLVFWSTHRLIKEPKPKWLILNSLFLSFLFLSHNLIILPFLFFYLIFVLFLLLVEKNKKKAFLLFCFSILLFLGLTSYFWLPAIFERQYTLVDEILTRELASYKLHFVYLRQFINSPWGYGGSIPGPEDGMSFEVGKIHLLLSLLAGILGIYLILKKKKNGILFIFIDLLLIASIFLASFHSEFIWDRIQPLWYLQFPWRLLIFSALFSSLLAGGLISYCFEKTSKSWFRWIIFFLPIFLVIILNKDYFKPARYLNVSDKDYINEEDLKWRVSKMSFEFVPKGIATVLSDIQTTQVDIKKKEIAKLSFRSEGNIKVEEEKILPHFKKFSVKGKGGILIINTYYFPGWEVKIDNKKAVIDDNNKFRLIKVKIPQGSHTVEAEFKNTPVRSTGNFLTVISLLIFLFLGLRRWKF